MKVLRQFKFVIEIVKLLSDTFEEVNWIKGRKFLSDYCDDKK